MVSMSPRWVSEKLCAEAGQRRAAEREREQCGSEKTERGHRQILMRRVPGQFC